MTATTVDAGQVGTRSTGWLAVHAFGALLLRDLRVLTHSIWIFAARCITQPLLVVFVFAYVFPEIGQGIGGSTSQETEFATLLAPGIMAVTVIMQGIQAVALPLVNEFGYTREIEDRVMAPLPVWGVAVAKIVSGALQAALSALVVVPLVLTIPTTPVIFDIDWLELVAVGTLSCLLAGSLGLAIGTSFQPRQISLIFTIIVIPMTFLGCVYYGWDRLASIEWLQWAVLANPLVYLSEGFRMALTDVSHMSGAAIYAGLIGFTTVLSWIGIIGFRKRVLA